MNDTDDTDDTNDTDDTDDTNDTDDIVVIDDDFKFTDSDVIKLRVPNGDHGGPKLYINGFLRYEIIGHYFSYYKLELQRNVIMSDKLKLYQLYGKKIKINLTGLEHLKSHLILCIAVALNYPVWYYNDGSDRPAPFRASKRISVYSGYEPVGGLGGSDICITINVSEDTSTYETIDVNSFTFEYYTIP
jgi:hypothetical protein